MDIDVLRTFADLAETGNFTRTAERLSLTQSAVSARIRQLEHRVGTPLFERRPDGARLSEEGRRFYQHTIRLLHIWERARFEARRPEEARGSLSLGIHPTLWSDLGQVWVNGLRKAYPDVLIRVELDYSAPLLQQVSFGSIDYALGIVEEYRKSIALEQLHEDRLIMVFSRPDVTVEGALQDYLLTDWGPVCNAEHAARLPDHEDAAMRMGVGTISMDYVLSFGGTTYMQERLAQPYIEGRILHAVADAPVLTRPVYGFSPLGGERDPMREDAVRRLKRMFTSLLRSEAGAA